MNSSGNKILSGRLTDIEKIAKYIKQDKDQKLTLSDRQKELFERLKSINRWLMKNPPGVVVRMIRNTFTSENGHAVSERTAYRYIQYSKDLFNSISTAKDSDFGARLVMEWAYEARELAIRRKDARAYVSLLKVLIDAFGLKDANGLQIDPEDLQQNNFYVQLNIIGSDGQTRERIDLNNIDHIPEEQRQRAIIDVQEAEFHSMEDLIRKYEEEQ